MAKASETRFRYSDDGQKIDMYSPRTGEQQLRMVELEAFAAHIVDEFSLRLKALLPEGVDFPKVPNRFTDNSGESLSSSFLDNSQVRKYLDPIRDQVKAALFRNDETRHRLFRGGVFDKKSGHAFLKKDQDFLAAFAALFEWLCGNPARAAQAIPLTFRPYGSQIRNMYLMGDFLVLGWPQTKVRRGVFHLQPSLWAFPAPLTWDIIFYFGVQRDIIVDIVSHMGGSSGLLRTHIFVDSVRASKQPNSTGSRMSQVMDPTLWTGKMLNSSIKSLSSNHKFLDDKILRQLFASIVGKHIPQLTDMQMHGVIRNAQNPLSNETLGLDSQGFHTAFNMSRHNVEGFLVISQVWQSFWGISSLNAEWKEALFGRPAFITEENRRFAFEIARRLVVYHYMLGCASVQDRKEMVAEIFLDLRFLRNKLKV